MTGHRELDINDHHAQGRMSSKSVTGKTEAFLSQLRLMTSPRIRALVGSGLHCATNMANNLAPHIKAIDKEVHQAALKQRSMGENIRRYSIRTETRAEATMRVYVI